MFAVRVPVDKYKSALIPSLNGKRATKTTSVPVPIERFRNNATSIQCNKSINSISQCNKWTSVDRMGYPSLRLSRWRVLVWIGSLSQVMMREGLSFLRAPDMFGFSNEDGQYLAKRVPAYWKASRKECSNGYLRISKYYSLNKCGSI